MNHRSMPSLSSSISSTDTNSSPRTSSSSSCNRWYSIQTPTPSIPVDSSSCLKRNSEPTPRTKRWDDSQLEMELAEDDLICKRKVRRNSSLRFKHTLQLSDFKDKFRHRTSEEVPKSKLSRSLKKVRDWLF